MSCDVLEYAERKPLLSFAWAVRAVASTVRRIRGVSLRLDLDSTSDYIKKDLGILDGRMPRQDDDILG